jgi:polysaccharide export outer membrane protein
MMFVSSFGLSCAHQRPFVWVDAARDIPVREQGYTIGVGDVLSVRVWNQDAMSSHVRVRADGRVSLPLIGDVVATGKAPAALATELEGGLKQYVREPKVYVIVEESKPLSVSVIGEVARPGLYPLEMGSGLAQALASAGGLTAFAHKDGLFVIRAATKGPRIRFRYDDVTQNVGNAASFVLRSGDVVVVE